MKRLKRTACITALCAVLPLLSGCGRMNSAVGFCMDTVMTASGYCGAGILEEAAALCADYEMLMSRTAEGSDVWKINHAGGKPVEVDPRTAEVIALALEVGEKSGGGLDITVAPAVELWDFKSKEHVLPDGAELKAAAANIDFRKLSLKGNRVELPAGMAIDLGAVAKGCIADRCVEYLRERGVKSAVVNIGGNVAVLGGKPGGRPWTVGIQDPAGSIGKSIAAVKVRDKAVVTSGVYQRGFDLGGVRYHHILDPDTGWPVQNGLAGVTVIADSSALADALSTACFVLGEEKGMALAEEYGAEAVFVGADGSIACTAGAAVSVK